MAEPQVKGSSKEGPYREPYAKGDVAKAKRIESQSRAHDNKKTGPGNAILLQVVTPEGSALETLVDQFTAPSVQGTFGVLPGHVPVLASLATGIVTYEKGGKSNAFAVGPGFVEVADNIAVLITDRYAEASSVDAPSVRERLEELNQRVSSWEGDLEEPEIESVLEEELWLATLLELYGDPPPPVVRLQRCSSDEDSSEKLLESGSASEQESEAE